MRRWLFARSSKITATDGGYFAHVEEQTQKVVRRRTLWIWLSLALLLSLAGYVLHEWFYLIRASGYTIDFPAPYNAAIERAHFARLGLAVVLPFAIASYYRKPSLMSRWVRWPYLCAIGLAVAVLMIFWTTRFRHW